MTKKIKKKSKKERGRFTSIDGHKKEKSRLVPPLLQLPSPLDVLEWERDFLVEHLWIECLFKTYPQRWKDLYNEFLDELDKMSPKNLIHGFITDFGFVPDENRNDFIENNEDLIHEAFYVPFGRMVALYPESPCFWLLLQKHLDGDGPVDPDVELKKLRDCVVRLLPAKDLYAGHIRVIPFIRMLMHEKIQFSAGLPTIDLIPKYPGSLSEDEQYRVQQSVRLIMNMVYQNSECYKSKDWPKYFWRHNYDIVPCVPRNLRVRKDEVLIDDAIENLHKILIRNSERAVDYVGEVALKHKYDLYDAGKDEILLGLFSRITRIYVLVLSNPQLWARDIAGIMIRCIIDTAITFVYLAKVGTEKDFNEFRVYGEGKEKLLMLHLQDTYIGGRSLEGRSAEDIAEDIGGGSFSPELINVELGNWTKKTTRDLAIDAGMEEFYRLVYDPTSSDVHGTWISLKNSNLIRCVEPLHRFHRIPQYFEPPLFVNTIEAIQGIYKVCIDVGIEHIGFPVIKDEIENISFLLKGVSEDTKSSNSEGSTLSDKLS